MKYVVEAQIGRAVDFLNTLGIEAKKAPRTILASLATAAKKRVQARMGSHLRERTGWLRKHLYGRARSSTHYVVAAPRHIAEILEKGGTIRAKKGRFLTFRGDDGSYHRMRSVTIPARHWFTQSIEGFEGSAEVGQAIDKALAKIIRKAEK